jgi:hypothetical protein
MTVFRRLRVATLALVPLTCLSSVTVLSPPGAAGDQPEPAEVALAWQGTALATVPFTPAKSLYLAFTSEAVDKAVRRSLRAANSSETAAVAQAAHDVLAAYFPGASATLDARLAESLAGVPNGPAENRGVAIGAEAAAEQVASRVGDGRNDASIVYSATPGIGIWTDTRPMATPWYGFVDRIAGGRPVPVDGPDPVGSPAYRADLAEVQADGRAGADAGKAATATFFNVDVFALYRNGLIAHLRANPLSLASTTALFADLDVASAEAMRQVWRHKFTGGFWRPVVAITSDDGDPQTTPVPGWTTVLPTTPPYPEYPSGHGAATGSFAEAVRCHLGEIPLTISGAGAARDYPSLSAMEGQALLSRIWGGIHFRDAMEDAYLLGHSVARQVCR